MQEGNQADPYAFYEAQSKKYLQQYNQLEKIKGYYSNGRLVVIIVTLIMSVLLYRLSLLQASACALSCGILFFIILVIRHATLFQQAEICRILAAVNRHGVERCKNTWNSFSDNGSDFYDKEHPYSADLDIFGKGSLFQYCNCAHSYFGRKTLASFLSGTASTADGSIEDRQLAVAELADNVEWRQRYEYWGSDKAVLKSVDKIIAWGEDTSESIPQWLPVVAVILHVAMAISIIIVFVVKGFIAPLSITVFFHILISSLYFQRNVSIFDQFEKNTRGIKRYGKMAQHVVLQTFNTAVLMRGQEALKGKNGALPAFKRLGAILAASEARYAPLLWFLTNAFLLWDINCVLRLTAWKKQYGAYIGSWLMSIARFEALSSMAIIRFEHPLWCMPKIVTDVMAFKAEQMGHPLLSAPERIDNDYSIGPSGGAISLITGSNMSGKSTFLRTIGVNLVLAYAGAPVCAASLQCGKFIVYTSMRTGDDLLSHTSTFYAELLRVKKIVDAVNKKEKVFFLLDELFRGTNSVDRHDGAVALLRKLSTPTTLGCVATHDLELCTLAQSNQEIINYHFKEWYEDNEITFDYQLQKGPSNTRNALFLMKMVGITA